ncbi:MAG TPA: tetratricopeptide repeat-containing glycosyltransferase family protein [Steroidobacteraceae bacterium]|nr:tetratricopeptide repeat-containing glycosyltransferase family protein [Steroidobacteraceae bacterium]
MNQGTLLERGMALHRAGRLAEAERVYKEALRQNPDDWRAHLSLGGAQLAQRRISEALASFDATLALQPQCVDAHHGRGMALQQLQRSAAALASFDAALALAPQSAELCNSRGNALRRLQRLPEALASYERALALQPQLALAHSNRGLVLQALGRYRDAAESYERALALQPNFAEAHNNLGAVQSELGEPAAALASYRRALELRPALTGAHGNLGNALRDLERPAEALAEFERALLEAPDSAVNHCHRGNALFDLGRLRQAIAAYDRALELEPRYAQAHFNKSVCLLLAGDLSQGLPLYEWRKELKGARAPQPAAPVWNGTQDLSGRTLFIYADQALGDTLQFCRYAQLAERRGAHVILSVQPQLTELLSSLGGAIRIVSAAEPPPACDYQSALLSLPLAFATTLSDVPASVPYLSPDPRRVAAWGERLGNAGFKVGIAWQGSRHRIDVGRSVPLAMFAPLAAIPGVRLISLQKEEEGAPGELPLELPGRDFDAGSQAFLDTAALMQHLDLVITSDTAVAHLAGALGRPAWVALKYLPDWRWLLERSDSPWYPSLRLFRQSRIGDWDSVFTSIRRELETRAA